MKLSTIALLAFFTLLVGCDKEVLPSHDEQGVYATLHFDGPINARYLKPGEVVAFTLYPDNIIESLRGLGIQVEGLEFKFGKNDPTTLEVVIKSALFGPDQQAALKTALSDILQAKQRSGFGSHVFMDLESPAFDVSSPQLYERSEKGVYIHPQSKMNVEIKYKYVGNYNLILSHGKTEFFCHVSSTVNHDFPFRLAVVARNKMPEKSGLYEAVAKTWNYSSVGVVMKFEDETISRLVSEGKLEVVMESPRLLGADNKVSVVIGSLGIHIHDLDRNQEFARLSTEKSAELKSKCQSMAVELGRPFTFHFGEGLDRLKSVVYKEQPAI